MTATQLIHDRFLDDSSVNSMGSLTYVDSFNKFYMIFLITFFSLIYFIMRIQYITYIQNMCLSTVYVIGKTSGQWKAFCG